MAVVTDTFTDTSGTALTSHTGEVGATWTAMSGLNSLQISNANRCNSNGGTVGGARASGTPAAADYDVQASVHRFDATGEAGVLGRVSNSDNDYYRATISSIGGNNVELYKFVSGSPTKLGGADITLANGNDYVLKLNMVGTAIKVYVDGSLIVSATDSGISTTGKAGAYSHLSTNAAGYNLDDFSAVDAGGGGGGVTLTELERGIRGLGRGIVAGGYA